MNGDAWLDDLFWRITSLEDGANIIGPAELRDWPKNAVAELSRLGILIQCAPSSRVVCPACEDGHEEPVHFTTDVARVAHAAVRCPLFGRVEIELSELVRWQLQAGGFAKFLLAELGAEGPLQELRRAREWALGILRFDDARRNVVLDLDRAHLLCLAGGGDGDDVTFGLTDLIRWDGETLMVDPGRIATAVLSGPSSRKEEAEVQPAYMFRSAGRGWQLAFQGPAFFVEDLKGMRLIRSLLAQPNRWVPIFDMVQLAEPGLEAVDAETFRELRRLAANGDATTAQLKTFIRSVTRPDGASKRTGGSVALASNAASMNIRRAIIRIRKENGEMADHLYRCVKTGMALSYQCEERLEWAY